MSSNTAKLRFNPPPNWPVPPTGWEPPPGWTPDPEWGPAPHGWPLWTSGRGWFARHKVLTGVGSFTALMLLLCMIGGIAGGGTRTGTPGTEAVAATGPPSASVATAAEKAAIEQAADAQASADKASTEKKAAEEAAAKTAAEKAAKEKVAKAKAAREKVARKRAANKRVAMPNLVGLKLNIAMDVISNVGLKNVTVCRTPGGDMPLWFSNWRIIGQDVPAGKKIKVGAEVCLDAMKDSDM